ncbi:TauD/TfdA family dioxygenase [Streptomyces somaliensis]|uniref:TauD/TfdA dioxygenase family protein n=1 Tax=Streptomyces somaliensis TaxID=78355 RepID=UPI0020CF13E3|nr:TauD/TfdA family dioxygenase [Streptomyces somaliensis]MCP9944193.1 TauD/TfdA family dioxygenase [Streptomyces somaliensis]MCP9962569.1 TauD/TfdA family dioxygenase [Streptomyces somaliensis]MCP9975400.1 TauD/TfdA family dioxygenase [Streptomyces somaliensis]MCQ0023169.1 TauD/TfdA family dioxygenase [Streptomyces somaliensis DSM 40738]
MTDHTVTALKPFGAVVEARREGTDLGTVDPEAVRALVDEHRVVVLRRFRPWEDKEGLVAYARRWGPILSWDFGEVLDLEVHADPKDYVFTPGPVPYHWDGAFAERTPAHQIFQCVRAPARGTGGRTTFCDTTMVLDALPAGTRARWEALRITYRKEKTAHYGGHITVPLVRSHPRTGTPVIRYAEPLAPGEFLSPLFLDVEGLPEGVGAEAFFTDIRERLYSPEVMYEHAWEDGDFVVTDNHALLHGRTAFTQGSPRHLRRVHVL